ncbi:hypothetical protein [Microbispora triticiradicis]|uniref:hypothetical protein n=1 Tax=Microbispora triticiradicis TaxID=2200763 RepID=UPI001AD69898|nr:hypothetical protein [Microbispora triticiradicis]
MIVIDSGPLIAALNIRDRYHEACARLLQTHPEPLIVPATVWIYCLKWSAITSNTFQGAR